MTDQTNQQAKTTIFVTVLAWILISFTGVGAASALLQNVLVNIMFAMPDMDVPGTATQGKDVFFGLRILVAVLFLFLTFALVSAIGVLKRKDWARRTFITLFGLGIGFHALALLLFLIGTGVLSSDAPTREADVRFANMVRLMVIPMAVGAVGISVLFGWLIKRLASADIRREFGGRVAT